MKKKKKVWPWLIVIVVVLAAALLVLPRFLIPSNTALTGQQYETYQVTKGDIQVTVHGTGSIEAMDTKTVSAGANGKVDTVLVENGDAVKKGQLLATLNADDKNTTIKSLKEQIITQDATIASTRAMPTSKTLTTPVAARVKAIYAKVDEDTTVSMSAQGALMLLSTDGNMKVSFVPASGKVLVAGSKVKFIIAGKKVSGFISTVPDSTTDKAEAILPDDSYGEGTAAIVQDSKGAELGRGTLESNRPLMVTAYTGTVDHIYVKTGDKLKKGHKLVKLDGTILDANYESLLVKRQQLQDDLDQAYDDLADYSITAPADGIVTDLSIQESAVVQQGMAVCTIQQNASFKLIVAADELDIPSIKLGQKADIKIDALPNQTASGEVIKISPIGVKSNDVTTYDVTLKVTAPAGAMVQMNASADIEVAFKADTLLVPVEAVHTVNGKSYVYGTLPTDSSAASDPTSTASAAKSNRTGFFGRSGSAANANLQRKMIEVTMGLTSDSSVEILSGLQQGDEIAVPIAKSTSSSVFGMGAGISRATSDTGSTSSTTSSSGK
jgi:HlyD family secretion protein